jgi:hypothetical protein
LPDAVGVTTTLSPFSIRSHVRDWCEYNSVMPRARSASTMRGSSDAGNVICIV